jgi:hypothetical protein
LDVPSPPTSSPVELDDSSSILPGFSQPADEGSKLLAALNSSFLLQTLQKISHFSLFIEGKSSSSQPVGRVLSPLDPPKLRRRLFLGLEALVWSSHHFRREATERKRNI